MSNLNDTSAIRQQRSENNSVSSNDWDMANDVFVSCYEDPMAVHGEMDSVQPVLDRHLPLIRADQHDGILMGLVEEQYSGYCTLPESATGYLDVDSNYTESDGNVSTKKRNRSNSSRHRDEVVTELGPEEVRWFYKEDKRTWKPFVGHDSLKIEVVYRRFCELNPDKVKRRVPSDADLDLNEVQAENASTEAAAAQADLAAVERGSVSDERNVDGNGVNVEAVCVRGGLYEVDVKGKECYPVYWNQQDRIPVMRGQWFIDCTWLPLEEDESDAIELEHLARFRGQQMRDTYEPEEAAAIATAAAAAALETKDAIHSLKLSRSHVDWHGVDEVYLYSDATTSKIARTVTQRLGWSKSSSSGTRLHRGCVEEAAPEDTPPETTHIVFVVHGIGQKMDQGRIIRNTSMMRDAARKMEEKHFSNRTTEHVEFLPVEWRSKLALDGDTVDSITPDKVRGLRDMLNSSAMDIMYYTSPLYRDEITRGLTLELNRLYTLFCTRNPEFQDSGKVSIVSHSLGCVITFDIMTGWDPVRFHHQEAPDPEETRARWPSHEERHLQEQLRLTRLRLRDLEDQFQGLQTSSFEAVPALKFKVENFFCMGSPLAVFLALRGIRPGIQGTQDHILPKSICQRLFNIFHPTDPVAYRLEPLVLKHYSNVAPVQINWYNTVNPMPYDHIRPTLINPLKESTSISDSDTLLSPCTSPPQARRHYGDSFTSLGKASIMGAASIGKGISGILFSRFSRSSGHVGGLEEEPSDLECGATEGESVVGSGEEGGRAGVVVLEAEEKEEERKEAEPTMSQSSSAILDSTSVELEQRVDFELREGMVESRYLTAVTSHTAYWCSYDVALFLLTFMYRQQEYPEPNDAEQS